MIFRAYDPSRDRAAAHRIWQEVGWMDKDDAKANQAYVEAANALVVEMEGAAECLVCTAPGTLRYLSEDLSLCAVTGVTTSRIARRQGLARRLLARALAADVEHGAKIAGLSMFEQGYYDRLGFAVGPYDHEVLFDPGLMNPHLLHTRPRVPQRVTPEDWEAAHACRLARRRLHGGVNVQPAALTQTDMQETTNGFGLGYRDSAGNWSHCMWLGTKEKESGPYYVYWMAWHTRDEFLELMGLLRNLGDQVRLVRLVEPADIQLQDLMLEPFKRRQVSRQGKFESGIRASGHFQYRMLDVPGCLAQTRLPGDNLRFNLHLSDPLEATLTDEGCHWRGVGGSYVVTLGADSSAEPGESSGLPTLTATVNAFTRLWLGVRPATGLAVTDHLKAPEALLASLDALLRLPTPQPDWDF